MSESDGFGECDLNRATGGNESQVENVRSNLSVRFGDVRNGRTDRIVAHLSRYSKQAQ